ncbi:kanamycin kinase [Povalibacter uvarum]|uniref:Aminoglycoside 3'-phosphotransferase n=1 Tax=Povalibacter uvarum TaxID=732238 RepID=A0A841HM01_9GAMM|nr:aminoglycoside 3'-phosphotransferase [Povalibacter uvarum]MBB6093896.1 kanamycin kinase [Povalibacter uvarum]
MPRLVWTNERGGTTFRIGDRFLKWNPRNTGIDLDAERLRLEWAVQYHSVPRVLGAGADEEAQWLITSALRGSGAVTEAWIGRPLEAARAIGRGLRLLHDALPVAECPFQWAVQARVGHRVATEELRVPPVDKLVVCHGDPCSPNTIIADDGSPAGHVDMGSLGVADRWADLAVASMNLDYNYGAGWEDAFFDAYGIRKDEYRVGYYRFLWDNEDSIGVSSVVTRELGLLGLR